MSYINIYETFFYEIFSIRSVFNSEILPYVLLIFLLSMLCLIRVVLSLLLLRFLRWPTIRRKPPKTTIFLVVVSYPRQTYIQPPQGYMLYLLTVFGHFYSLRFRVLHFYVVSLKTVTITKLNFNTKSSSTPSFYVLVVYPFNQDILIFFLRRGRENERVREVTLTKDCTFTVMFIIFFQ